MGSKKKKLVRHDVVARVFANEVHILEMIANAKDGKVSRHQLWEYGFPKDVLDGYVTHLMQ